MEISRQSKLPILYPQETSLDVRNRMDSYDYLINKVADLEAALKTASTVFNTLKTESNDKINTELWTLYRAMKAASSETSNLIYYSRAAITDIESETSYAQVYVHAHSQQEIARRGREFGVADGSYNEKSSVVKIEQTLDSIVDSLDAVVDSSETLLDLSVHYNNRVVEFQKEHLSNRLRNDIENTLGRVEYMKENMNEVLEERQVEATEATAAILEINQQVAHNKSLIQNNRVDLEQKQDWVQQLLHRKRRCELGQAESQVAAGAARQRANEKRLLGTLVTVGTLGLGVGYGISSWKDASQESSRAKRHAVEARSFSSQADSLHSSCKYIESEISRLEAINVRLETEQRNLTWESEQKQSECAKLRTNIKQLQGEVYTANGLTKDLAKIETSSEELSIYAHDLRKSLHQLKVNASACRDHFVEHRDRAVMSGRRVGKAYFRNAGRVRTIQGVAEQMLPLIQELDETLPKPRYTVNELTSDVTGMLYNSLVWAGWGGWKVAELAGWALKTGYEKYRAPAPVLTPIVTRRPGRASAGTDWSSRGRR